MNNTLEILRGNIIQLEDRCMFLESQLEDYEKKVEELEETIGNLIKRDIPKDVANIILEGEPTDIGRKVTIDRIKEYINFDANIN